jgi:signal transduction histidine kinase/CheY-like chemotaxis protein
MRNFYFGIERQMKKNEFAEFDKRFVMALSLVAGLMAIMGGVINLSLNFPLILQFIPWLGAIGFVITFFMAKNGNNVLLSKWLTTINSLIIVNLLWFFNYGSNGPAPYSILIFFWHGRTLVWISIFMGLNICGVFYIDLHFPNITSDYASDLARLVDTYTGILIYIIIIFVILRLSKISYMNAYRDAKKSDNLKSAFLANMSHEIRTPLNSITGFSELLTGDYVTQKQKEEYSNIIKENNQQLLHIINDILDVSKIEAGLLQIHKHKYNITELLSNLETTYKNIKSKKKNNKIELKFEFPKSIFYLKTDKSRLRQILINLLDNALKFTKEGSVTLGCKIDEDSVRFYVKDTGIGISDEKQKEIFNRFYKIENEENDVLYGGTGIGLFISHNLVKLLGGKLQVASAVNQGSEFHFSIPKDDFEQEIPKKENRIENNDLESLSSLKIMVAEDDPFNQHYYKSLFAKLNISIIQVYDGVQAVDKMKEEPDIDLIFMDIKMPNMTGNEALQSIKEFNTQVYIIAQTAHAMASDEADSKEQGFDDYIPKPIDVLLLKRKLIKAKPIIESRKQD